VQQLIVSDCHSGLSTAELHARVFSGEILAFQNLPGAAIISDRATAIFADVFDSVPIDDAHTVLAPSELKSALLQVRQHFARDRAVRAAYSQMLRAAGCAPETTYADRFILRANAPVADFARDTRMVLPAHRDSWGSGITAQINWWMPLNPLDVGRTMIVYPDAFARAVANDSDGWDWRSSGKAGVPRLPSVLDPQDPALGEPRALIVPPTTLVAFAGAHLHATAVNRTPLPRLSTDTRTVDREVWAAGLGAPDVDHGAVPPAVSWFNALADGSALTVPRADGMQNAQ